MWEWPTEPLLPPRICFSDYYGDKLEELDVEILQMIVACWDCKNLSSMDISPEWASKVLRAYKRKYKIKTYEDLTKHRKTISHEILLLFEQVASGGGWDIARNGEKYDL